MPSRNRLHHRRMFDQHPIALASEVHRNISIIDGEADVTRHLEGNLVILRALGEQSVDPQARRLRRTRPHAVANAPREVDRLTDVDKAHRFRVPQREPVDTCGRCDPRELQTALGPELDGPQLAPPERHLDMRQPGRRRKCRRTIVIAAAPVGRWARPDVPGAKRTHSAVRSNASTRYPAASHARPCGLELFAHHSRYPRANGGSPPMAPSISSKDSSTAPTVLAHTTCTRNTRRRTQVVWKPLAARLGSPVRRGPRSGRQLALRARSRIMLGRVPGIFAEGPRCR